MLSAFCPTMLIYLSDSPSFACKSWRAARDIFSVLADPEASKKLHGLLIRHVRAKTPGVQAFVALESRGFLFGSVLALEFGVPFVPIRKKGKLPGAVYQETYQLEYGTDILEVQKDSITSGQKVVIVDDLIATGGTLEAGCRLVRRCGATVEQCLVIMELTALRGRAQVSADVHSLIQY
ncbi:adenine phosphoribosyltransferase isoform X2 [Bacillus rossius redtenbacheri]|uniref:adenine phosphoribosyltransferase isoform X2 n=1 Tax=Bacillus rossius redtenbacheri TaxID=93214 RepID=UPI002FDC918D